MINTLKNINYKNFFRIFAFVNFYCFVYYFSLFIIKILQPNYYLCVEVVNQTFAIRETSINFLYPLSCDQKNYFMGFENFNNIITTEFYPYQTRSLYILFVYLIGKVFYFIDNIFNLNINMILNISTLFSQIFIISVSVYLLDKLLQKQYSYGRLTLFFITGLVSVNPLYKWGIFTPSHQLLTLLVLIMGIFVLDNYKYYELKKTSIILGILYLGHRSFLLVYLIYVFVRFIIQKKRNILEYLKSLGIFAIPSIFFYLYIRMLGYHPYDAATEYWGQFIWVFYFIAGRIKSEGEWYCQTIPENFICYFQDSINTVIYLLAPLVFVILKEITDIYFYNKERSKIIEYGIIFALVMYGFYSFIGWDPPLRFNLYSIGNCLIVIVCLQIARETNIFQKFIYFIGLFTYFINLNHWNYPELVNLNNGIIFSIVLMSIYFIVRHLNYFKTQL